MADKGFLPVNCPYSISDLRSRSKRMATVALSLYQRTTEILRAGLTYGEKRVVLS